MKKSIALSFGCVLSLCAADGLDSWLKEGKVYGDLRYYYINTAKETNGVHGSQHSNAIGGQLGYVTGSLYGLKLGATFMTTQPFAIPSNPKNVETSTIGRDNGVRLDGSPSGIHGDDGFSILGEAYAQYNLDNYEIWLGRKVLQSPLFDAKDVRMLPSSLQGGVAKVSLDNNIDVSAGYFDKFKQRTSNEFINIVKHALGAKTQAITGSDNGYMIPLSLSWKNSSLSTNVYDDYAPDFMNSLYADVTYKDQIDSGYSYVASLQGMMQDSVGHADDYLTANPLRYGGKINAQVVAAKVAVTYQGTTIMAACSHVFSNNGDHDSLVLPWDGTPLYTNMLTSNELFSSDYGKALTSDTAYIGGTTGIKFGVTQKFDFTGMQGLKGVLEYAHFDSGRFPNAQEDINAAIGYSKDKFSLDLKGIWVKNNTSAGDSGYTIRQDQKFTQYRVIGNYKF